MTTSPGAATARPPVTAGKLLAALRAFSLPMSMLPVPLATAAVLPVSQWRWGVLAAATAGAGLLHLTGNLLNDYFDFGSGVDRRLDDDLSRPGRLLVRGELLARDVLAEALACGVLALAASAYLIWRAGPALLAFGGAAVLLLYAYTGPPLSLKYRRLGELTIFLAFGPLLMAGAAWAQTGHLETAALLLSVPVGLMTTCVLISNNVRDLAEDRQAGIRTLGQIAGGRLSRGLYVGLELLALVWLAAMGAAGAGPRELLAAPLALVWLRGPMGAMIQGRRVPNIDARTARFEALVLAAMLAIYIIQPLKRLGF